MDNNHGEYNKLVRDNIPEILDKKGVVYQQRVASDEEYRIELFKKLDEEIAEFKEAYSIEELADIAEVIEAIKKLPEFVTIEEVRNKKLEERGGFLKKIIIKGSY